MGVLWIRRRIEAMIRAPWLIGWPRKKAYHLDICQRAVSSPPCCLNSSSGRSHAWPLLSVLGLSSNRSYALVAAAAALAEITADRIGRASREALRFVTIPWDARNPDLVEIIPDGGSTPPASTIYRYRQIAQPAWPCGTEWSSSSG